MNIFASPGRIGLKHRFGLSLLLLFILASVSAVILATIESGLDGLIATLLIAVYPVSALFILAILGWLLCRLASRFGLTCPTH